MKNKNTNILLLSLLSVPLLITSLLVAGTRVLADEAAQPMIITINTDELDSATKFVGSEPELEANLDIQHEIINSLDSETRTTARTYSHVPVVAASLTASEAFELEKSELVESVEPETIYRPSLTSSGAVIDTAEAYSLGYDGTGVAVAILDTGVDNDHSFLNVVSEACYSNAGGFGFATSLCPGGVPSSTDPESAEPDLCTASDCDHGTHVAGIAAGDGDGAAYTGVAKGADIIAIQVFTEFSSGCSPNPAPCLGAYTSDIILGLNRVLALHNDVGFTTPIASTNLSLGGALYSSQASCDAANSSTKTAIDNLVSVGIATIIASGNEYSSTAIGSPGCISSAIAVGATTDADVPASFSNSNSMVDLLAPGVSISSSIIGDGNFGSKSGTSMATPQVTGAWAVIKQRAPDATVDEILLAFQDSGTTVNDGRNGLNFKRIDLDDTLSHSNFSLITIDTANPLTTESGGTAIIEFSLSTAPTNPVTIPLTISDTNEATLSGVTQVVIGVADWNNPSANQVTVTGVDDVLRDGIGAYNLVTGDPTSLDAQYDGLIDSDVVDIALENVDDDYTTYQDFNGDGKTDILRTSNGKWYVVYGGESTWKTLNNSALTISSMSFGDFDGNGKTDIFKADGNAWYYAKSGNGSWKKIANSGAKRKQLRFIDLNGDNKTDIMKTANGKWYVVYGGQSNWTRINNSSLKVKQMGFSDFNGDSETDIMKTSNGKWYISYSGTSSWTRVATSGFTLTEMKFVDFNGDGKTDTLRTSNDKWFVVFGDDNKWQRINNSGLTLKDLRFGDFNGDNKTDVFRASGSKWIVSYGGTTSWTVIANSGYGFSSLAL